MSIHGNIVGNPVPRPNWDQTDSGAADFIKNKPDIDAISEKANNAVPNTGGTVSGSLYLGSNTNTDQISLYIRKVISEDLKSGRLYWTNDGYLRLNAASGGETYNYLELRDDSTEFGQPLSLEGGGTAAKTAEAALSNLGGLSKAGGTMTGAINMGSKKITNLGAPSSNADAANKAYVDGKRLSGTVTLTAAGWSSGAQEVSVSGILATDMSHWCMVYSSDASTREAEKEAFALVDELESQDGAFVFRCFGDVPTVDLNIQWEVNR